MEPTALNHELLDQVMQLPMLQRELLAGKLIDSLHPSGDSCSPEEWKDAWLAECQHRVMTQEKGDAKPVSAEDVLLQLKERHREKIGKSRLIQKRILKLTKFTSGMLQEV